MNRKLEKIIRGRKTAICNIGKFQEDMEYVFPEIQPEYYIDDSYEASEYKGRPVFRTEALSGRLEGVLIIVCDLQARQPMLSGREWQGFHRFGLEWGRDYIFAEELFPTLDFDWREKAAGRKIAFWGTGATTRVYYMEHIGEKEGLVPDIYINGSGQTGSKIYGIDVVAPEEIEPALKDYFIVVMTHGYYYEIYQYLTERGLQECEDFISYHFIFDRTHAKPSEMMRRTVYAKPIKNQPFCSQPFQKAHLRLDGNTILCSCPEYIDKYYAGVGNYHYVPYERIWNSPEAKIFRLSILNNTYCFCLEKMCDIMQPCREEDETVPRRLPPPETDVPPEVFLEIDEVCNLDCPSCRTEPKYNSDNRRQKRRMSLAEKLNKTDWLDRTDMITIAGHGEVFYSNVYRSVLYHDKDRRRKNITVLTNGTLFNEREFQHLQQCYEHIRCIVSVDGTTKEVYESLRPGANFEVLVRNLRNLGEHRANGELEDLQINFVVQRANYLQMKDMVRFCEDIHADRLQFIRMMNWLYPQEVFDRKSMTTPEGKLKPELAEVLRDDIFDSPIVVMPWFKHRMEMLDG